MDNIQWKPIHSLNDKYEASFDGKIRNAQTKKILKAYKNKCGYLTMTVRPAPKIQKNARVHRMVAEAFLGECPEGKVCNHKDGNKTNNNVDNLEYVTSLENNIHALKTNLRQPAHKKGRIAARRKITDEEAQYVRDLREQTQYGPRKLSKLTNIPRSVISGILYRNNYYKR